MEQDQGGRAGEAPVRPPGLMVMVATWEPAPSEWRPAGHPQVIMAGESQTEAVGSLLEPHLLTTQGLCRFPLQLPRGDLGLTSPQPPEHLSLEGIPGHLLSHQPRVPASICPSSALPRPNMGKQRLGFSQQRASQPAQA